MGWPASMAGCFWCCSCSCCYKPRSAGREPFLRKSKYTYTSPSECGMTIWCNICVEMVVDGVGKDVRRYGKTANDERRLTYNTTYNRIWCEASGKARTELYRFFSPANMNGRRLEMERCWLGGVYIGGVRRRRAQTEIRFQSSLRLVSLSNEDLSSNIPKSWLINTPRIGEVINFRTLKVGSTKRFFSAEN